MGQKVGMEEKDINTWVEKHINNVNQLLLNKDIVKVSNIFKKIESRINELSDLDLLLKIYSFKGYFHHLQNNKSEAINYFEKGLNVIKDSQKYNLSKIKILNSLGHLYKDEGEFNKAYKVLHEAIRISNQENIKNSISHNNLATLNYKLKKYDNAEKFYKSAIFIEQNKEKKDPITLIKYFTNLANLYSSQKKHKESIEIHKKTLSYLEKTNEVKFLISNYKGLANSFIQTDRFFEAEICLKKALAIIDENKLYSKKFELYLILSDVYKNLKNFSLQEKYILKSLKFYNDDFYNKINALEKLHRLYFDLKKYDLAYRTLLELLNAKQKIVKIERDQKLLELEEKFESEQKDILIAQEKKYNQQLQDNNVQLANLNEDLAQFNYGVSHDLKEPIRSVKGGLKILSARVKSKLNEEELAEIQRIQDAAARMEMMLEDLYQFSSLGNNLQKMKPVNLNEVLAIVQADLQLKIKETNTSILFDELPTIKGHKILLVQLFQNLINNAIKFRRPELDPKIQILYKFEEGRHVIHVQDNGKGIKKEDQANVFKLFKRLKSTEHVEGTGVGLSIVQKIVKKMQGEISLASVYGSGTCFIIKL